MNDKYRGNRSNNPAKKKKRVKQIDNRYAAMAMAAKQSRRAAKLAASAAESFPAMPTVAPPFEHRPKHAQWPLFNAMVAKVLTPKEAWVLLPCGKSYASVDVSGCFINGGCGERPLVPALPCGMPTDARSGVELNCLK